MLGKARTHELPFSQSFTRKWRHSINTFTFTFMHLADAFIQSDLHCIQVTVSTFYQLNIVNYSLSGLIFISQTNKVWKWVPSRSFLQPCATVKNTATPPFACHRRSRKPLARFSPPWQTTRICCRGKHEHIDAVLQELTGAETAA